MAEWDPIRRLPSPEGCETRISPITHPVFVGHGPLAQAAAGFCLGLSVNNFYVGGFVHADAIRTLATSTTSFGAQAATVDRFANDNFLKL